MNAIVTVMKKEFARFFGDKRMILMTLFPAILIYVVYTFIGAAVQDMFGPDETYMPVVYTVDAPDSILELLELAEMDVRSTAENQIENLKQQVTSREADILAIFPENFQNDILTFDPQTATGPAPNVEIFFNSAEPNSLNAFRAIQSVLDDYEAALANRFDINRDINPDLATASDISATIIASLMPMLLLIFIFSGVQGLAPESIAGEKERGTLATLLVTPLGRSELAAGKIISLAILSFISGIATVIATILSLPNLMGVGSDMLDVGIYSVNDYVLLSIVILATVLFFVAVVSIISAFAKTVKESGMAVMPMTFIVMLVGITGMFGAVAEDPAIYLIPIYNSVQAMNGIFSRDYAVTNIVIAAASNLVYAIIGGFALTKMFNSEKIMFSK